MRVLAYVVAASNFRQWLVKYCILMIVLFPYRESCPLKKPQTLKSIFNKMIVQYLTSYPAAKQKKEVLLNEKKKDLVVFPRLLLLSASLCLTTSTAMRINGTPTKK